MRVPWLAGASLVLEAHSFGPVLRAGRERRNITHAMLYAETKVRPEIWRALEEGHFAGWPTGIYARNLVRQYARHVDLDPDSLVNEFCRLFPLGDRRTDALMRIYAATVGQTPELRSIPSSCRRRGDPPAPGASFWSGLNRAAAGMRPAVVAERISATWRAAWGGVSQAG